jgi:hypothetical protein
MFGTFRNFVKLRNEELHKFCSSPDIITDMNSRRKEWTGYAVGLEEVRNAYNILGTNLEVNSTRG